MININQDTIAAIATPLGTGGVGAIRISGDDCFDVISKIFTQKLDSVKIPEFKANRIYHGWIVENGRPVDEVILLIFKNPHSYTGEDVVEIQCHGGLNVVKSILELTLKNGARLAEKGEFTKRAFLNGKLDLSKAEAVLDLIHSKTSKFASVSAQNLSGKLAFFVNEVRQEIINMLAEITAGIDFPDEVDEPEYEKLEEKIIDSINKIDKVLESANNSNLMRQGFKVALAGRPNVGKSSIFNSLLDLQRAIVTDIAGTTRDIIQESIDLNGIPLTLIDTAGIREIDANNSADYIENIGIDITKKAVSNADLVLFVFDLEAGLNDEDIQIYEEVKHKLHLNVGSKCDLNPGFNDDKMVLVSSKEKTGFEELKQAIEKKLLTNDVSSSTEFSTNIRQQECLNKAQISLNLALTSTADKQEQDFISIDLKDALLQLGEITGEVVTEEILDHVFENFCVGK